MGYTLDETGDRVQVGLFYIGIHWCSSTEVLVSVNRTRLGNSRETSFVGKEGAWHHDINWAINTAIKRALKLSTKRARALETVRVRMELLKKTY